MKRIAGWALAACFLISASGGAVETPASSKLTAAQIVEKNAAARGGVDAWRKIQTMAWAGHVDSASAPQRDLPFLLEQKRPNNTRFEIMAMSQKSVRIYDGTNGWKIRPNSSGRPEVQPYTDAELNFARDAQVIEGPLMDAAAKGVSITLGEIDEIEGRKTYRLDLRLRSGSTQRVWVDAETFLETRYDRESRSAAGQNGTVSVTYRNYQAFAGLQIPLTIETGSATGKEPDKLVIEKVALNPQLDDSQFTKPNVSVTRSKGVTVDTRAAAPPQPRQAARPAP